MLRSKATTPVLALAGISLLSSPLMAQPDSAASTSAFEMFFLSGGPMGLAITWLLIIMSVAVLALTIYAVMKNSRKEFMPDDLIDEMAEMIEERRFKEAIEIAAEEESIFGQVIHSALSEASSGYGAMQRAIEETTDQLANKQIRGLAILDVLGAIGPMIGLFGTVWGMIGAFQDLVNAGGSPNPADLANSIGTALVTTLWGLVVGIPAVAGASLIKTRIDGLATEAMIEAEDIISQFRPSAKKSSSKSSSSSAPKPKVQR